MPQPRLSVVVGSQNAYHTIEECLSSIEKQMSPECAELIVADYSTDGTTGIIQTKFPEVKLITFTKPKLIPELWGAGISKCTGDIVAFTTAHCIPDKKWISEILKVHDAPYAAVGGAIECSDEAAIVEWAVYFCRYSPYMKPFSAGMVQEVPGDNASYKKYALDGCKELWKDGFWETVINAKLRRDGEQLFSSPSIVVYHKRSFGLAGFSIQRFHHGIHFGATRSADFSFLKRIVYIGLSISVPFVYFFHIARRVLKKGRNINRFVLSSPILFLFLINWAAGEFLGYLSGLWKNQKSQNSPLLLRQ